MADGCDYKRVDMLFEYLAKVTVAGNAIQAAMLNINRRSRCWKGLFTSTASTQGGTRLNATQLCAATLHTEHSLLRPRGGLQYYFAYPRDC